MSQSTSRHAQPASLCHVVSGTCTAAHECPRALAGMPSRLMQPICSVTSSYSLSPATVPHSAARCHSALPAVALNALPCQVRHPACFCSVPVQVVTTGWHCIDELMVLSWDLLVMVYLKLTATVVAAEIIMHHYCWMGTNFADDMSLHRRREAAATIF